MNQFSSLTNTHHAQTKKGSSEVQKNIAALLINFPHYKRAVQMNLLHFTHCILAAEARPRPRPRDLPRPPPRLTRLPSSSEPELSVTEIFFIGDCDTNES
jgi:hypothetical protein